ncbi:hypothetical protein [Rhodoferax sp.]|uniref:hypothetical protein n=1 Tax=Rhodoferax sp. TaxID=50421 RepID=UPI00261B4A64|nr:hypothetical protein [Rhodoferax sp.]MDD2809196.1 hypothetical protein [Rhodoferax sp.]MDD4944273.1 hypothetical protein [Rhodoferax sp.]
MTPSTPDAPAPSNAMQAHNAHRHAPDHPAVLTTPHHDNADLGRSVLAWPAWLRVASVLPVVLVLWLAVWWANGGVAL